MSDTVDKQTTSDKTQPDSKSPMYTNIVLTIVILGMVTYGFMKGNFDGVSKQELNANYVQKSQISFDSLSRVEKNDYVSKDTYLAEIERLENQLENQPPKVVEKVVEKIVYKDKIVEVQPKVEEKVVYKEKVVEADPRVIEKLVEKTVYKDKTIDRSKFDVFRCYGMSPSGYRVSSQCVQGLKKFLDKNKDAKYFEVIAVMNPKDFRTIMIMEQKSELLKELDLYKEQVAKLKELSTVGLDKLRVVEIMWEVKKVLGKDTIVVPVSYNVNSKTHRGVVLRAYK